MLDNFSPLTSVLILSGLLCAFCHVRLLFSCEPISESQAYDLKTLYKMRATTFIIFVASVVSLNLPQIPNDSYFLFWLTFAFITTFFILINTGNRLFNIFLCAIEIITCFLQYTYFVLYSEGLYTSADGYLYKDITFALNCMQILLLIGGFIVQKSIRVRHTFSLDYLRHSWSHPNSFNYTLGRTGFVRAKVKKRAEESRAKNKGPEG